VTGERPLHSEREHDEPPAVPAERITYRFEIGDRLALTILFVCLVVSVVVLGVLAR
jgi:hypothetical protein